MKRVVILCLAIILDLTNAGSSLNMALETVFEFDETVGQEFIEKIQDVLDQFRDIFIQNNQYKLSDFVEDFIVVTKSLKDREIVKLFDIICNEIRLLDIDDDNFRRHVEKLDNVKRNPTNIRRNLDHILTKLRDNKDKRNNFFINFINSLYKRNSERKFINIIKGLKILRTQSDKEIKAFIKKSIQDLITDLNVTDDKEDILRTWLDFYTQSFGKQYNNNDFKDTESTSVNNKVKLRKKQTKSKIEANNKIEKIYKKMKKGLLNKLTHITLYPDNFDTINNNNIKASTLNNKSDEDEVETQERSENESDEDTNETSYRDENDIDSIKTTGGDKDFELYRHSPQQIEPSRNLHQKIKNKKYITSPDSTSNEYFGNLYKQKDLLRNKHYNKVTSTTVDILKTDNIRRSNAPTSLEIVTDRTTFKTSINNMLPNKTTPNIITNNTNSYTFEMNHKISTDITKNTIIESSTNRINISTILKNNKTSYNNKSFEEISKNITEITSVTPVMVAFDVNDYLKKSDVQDINDIEKKKEIERKMKEDLNSLFFMPTTNASTTETYTDIFKDLEDEFELS